MRSLISWPRAAIRARCSFGEEHPDLPLLPRLQALGLGDQRRKLGLQGREVGEVAEAQGNVVAQDRPAPGRRALHVAKVLRLGLLNR